MSLIIDNLRFAILTYFTLLALVFSNVNSVSAFEENEVRRENKRVWSIIKGKVKLDKSAYTVKRVRILTPKVELIKPPQLDEKKRISASKLYSMSRSYADYMTQKSEKNKKRTPYSGNLKGSAKSFDENEIERKKFCNTAISSSYCLLESESKYYYFGNTPKKHKRKRNYSDRNVSFRIRESIKLVDKLVKQSKN